MEEGEEGSFLKSWILGSLIGFSFEMPLSLPKCQIFSLFTQKLTVLGTRHPELFIFFSNWVSKSKQKSNVKKLFLKIFSWSGYWKVEFWKFEDKWSSFCLAYILTSHYFQMILVPSIQMTIQPSKFSIEITSTLTSPRLRDYYFMKKLEMFLFWILAERKNGVSQSNFVQNFQKMPHSAK